MANRSKEKGDRYERESVPAVVELLPEFAVPKPMRMLGAGRKEDIGDIHVLPDASIQVKAWKELGAAIRAAAEGAVVQAGHGDKEFALGLVPIVGARKGAVKWIACTARDRWPLPVEPVAEFAMVSRALKWLKDDTGPYGYRVWPRLERIALLAGAGAPVLVAPLEAWAHAYRSARGGAPLRAAA